MKVSRQEQRRVRDVKKPNSNAWRTGKDGSAARAKYGEIELWFTGRCYMNGVPGITAEPLKIAVGARCKGFIEGYSVTKNLLIVYLDEARILKWRYLRNGQGFNEPTMSRSKWLSRVRPDGCFVPDRRKEFCNEVRRNSSAKNFYNFVRMACGRAKVPPPPIADVKTAFVPLHIRPGKNSVGYSLSPNSKSEAHKVARRRIYAFIAEWINNQRNKGNKND